MSSGGSEQRGVEAPAPRDRVRRALGALAVTLGAWLLVPHFFPYLSLDPYLQRLLARCPVEAAVAVGNLLPYLLLGVSIYCASGLPGAWARRPRTRRWLNPLAPGMAIVGAVGLAYAFRFTADDAYISFRYASNLIEGAGLVYNPGERVEGYTNFLWVMLVAAGAWVGAAPVTWAHGLGLACFAGTLAMTYRLARLVLPDACWAVVTVLLVGTQFSMLSFATSGLETSLQTFLLISGCTLVVSRHLRARWETRDLLLMSFVFAAGVLTRMDFALFGMALAASVLWSVRAAGHRQASREGHHRGARELTWPIVRSVAALLLPALVIVGVWLVWKRSYYGDILPNTYHAKAPAPGAAGLGLAYLWDFCKSYRYQLPLIVFLAGTVQLIRERHVLLFGVACVLFWCGYLVKMGGGFIEFRFLVPIVPLFLLCVMWTVTRFSLSRRLYLPALVAVWMAYGSLHHARSYGWVQNRAEPVAHLKWQTEDALWAEAGRELHRAFAHDDVVIATTVAGILPYHARLRTIDMHGLAI